MASQGLWEEVGRLIDLNANVVAKTDDAGNFLLAEIARVPGSVHAIRKLVMHGANVDGITWNGTRAIGNAILGGSRLGANTLKEVRVLVQLGASLTAEVESAFPPLHWAIVNCRLEHVQLLLDLGANPLQGSHDSPPETAFDVARRMQYRDAIEVLKAHKDSD